MFGHIHHHLNKKVSKSIGISVSVCILACGIGLAYAVYQTANELSGAEWVPVSSNVTYTYSLRVSATKTSASFTPNYLVTASYTYTSGDGVSHQGHDYATISGQAPQPTSEMRAVYYDHKNTDVSRVFTISYSSDFRAWIFVIILIFLGAMPLIVTLQSD
jgi:hypothetical protein